MMNKNFDSVLKHEKQILIFHKVIELEVTIGHLKWKMTDLARKTRIPRTSIYYYLGKNKKIILMESVTFFGQFLAGVYFKHIDDYKKNKFTQGLYRSKLLIFENPYVLAFYFQYRNQNSAIGELIRHYEDEGVAKRKAFFPKLKPKEAEFVFALHTGLCLSRHIKDEKDISLALNFFKI